MKDPFMEIDQHEMTEIVSEGIKLLEELTESFKK